MLPRHSASAPQGAVTAPAGAAPRVSALGRAATLALYDELALSPKPGLVTLLDAGSHADMDARSFLRSLLALRGYFPRIAALGTAGAGFEALERCGLAAEARMLRATGGVNTHRGAIFSLGLLCAAAGAVQAEGSPPTREALAQAIRHALLQHWGDALARRALRPPRLPGGLAASRHGLRSASAEAAAGFPVLFEVALPALGQALACGLALPAARLQTLFAVMAVLDDANLAHRGGLQGLRDAQAAARGWLAAGGGAAPDAVAHAQAIGQRFVARRLSPGGAADMLAAACWLQRIGAVAGGRGPAS